MFKKKEWILPSLIFLLGGILRFALLGVVPGGVHQDESFVIWNAFSLYQEGIDSLGNRFPVYLSTWGDGQSALYSWMLLPFYAVSGGRVPPLWVCRLPQAICALCTVCAVYFLLKRMSGRQTALWGAFALAICPWHVMMSRWGLDANLAPAFLIFGLFFFVKGIDDLRFLPLSALFYGLSLYCYAVIWIAVPIILLLQSIYCLKHKKLKINRWTVLSALILFLTALPLLLFVLVNQQLIPQINLPFLTIPRMNGYRGGEFAFSLSDMLSNLKRAVRLFLHQDLGSPYDVLLPHGMFYDLGRIFILIGFFRLLFLVFRNLRQKNFSYEMFLLIQLIGAGAVVLTVSVHLHQHNCLYIPLVLCEAFGIQYTVLLLSSMFSFKNRAREPLFRHIFSSAAVLSFLLCLFFFQKDYYTGYRTLTDAYFAKGLEKAVPFAMACAEEEPVKDIIVEKGTQWPRILLFSETKASQYLENVVYSQYPLPLGFTKGDIAFHIGIDYDSLHAPPQESVYILYYTDEERFRNLGGFSLTKFEDWYVAAPKK